MVFRGKGIVWNPKRGKALVNFKHIETYETDDREEIELLSKAIYVEVVGDPVKAPEPPVVNSDDKELTRAELIPLAKERGIKGASQMKRADLIERLAE